MINNDNKDEEDVTDTQGNQTLVEQGFLPAQNADNSNNISYENLHILNWSEKIRNVSPISPRITRTGIILVVTISEIITYLLSSSQESLKMKLRFLLLWSKKFPRNCEILYSSTAAEDGSSFNKDSTVKFSPVQ